jgi:hypothetical protein
MQNSTSQLIADPPQPAASQLTADSVIQLCDEIVSTRASSDVWIFVQPYESQDLPANFKVEPVASDAVPLLEKKPKAPFVGCRLCRYISQLCLLHYYHS